MPTFWFPAGALDREYGSLALKLLLLLLKKPSHEAPGCLAWL